MRVEQLLASISNPGTRSEYKKPILLYLKWLEENELEPVPYDPNPAEQIRKLYSQINAFFYDRKYLKSHMSKLRGSDISASYLNVMFAAISKLYEKVYFIKLEKDFIDLSGTVSNHSPIILSEHDISMIMNNAPDIVIDTMIRVGYHCALRASELVTLKGENYSDGILRVRVAKSRRLKYKEVVLPPDLAERIENMIESKNRYIFRKPPTTTYKNINRRRWLPGEWSTWFGNYTEDILGKRVRWHDFARHTRLTLYAEQPDTDFKDVLLLSGHANPSVCLMYFERAKSKVEGINLPSLPW